MSRQKREKGIREDQAGCGSCLQQGKPVPVSIVLGITDGTFSEVISGDLREGDGVIVEETSTKKSQSSSPSPFGQDGQIEVEYCRLQIPAFQIENAGI